MGVTCHDRGVTVSDGRTCNDRGRRPIPRQRVAGNGRTLSAHDGTRSEDSTRATPPPYESDGSTRQDRRWPAHHRPDRGWGGGELSLTGGPGVLPWPHRRPTAARRRAERGRARWAGVLLDNRTARRGVAPGCASGGHARWRCDQFVEPPSRAGALGFGGCAIGSTLRARGGGRAIDRSVVRWRPGALATITPGRHPNQQGPPTLGRAHV